jgi:Glycine zipper
MRHTNPTVLLGMALVVAACLGGGQALGDDMYIYPSKGQSPEQQSRDRYECHRWAVQQTGVDPTSAQAALGAVGGAIAGDAAKGTAIGAATGGLIGGMKQRGQAKQQQQAQANQAAQQQSALVAYNRAVSACLSGRGYTVK